MLWRQHNDRLAKRQNAQARHRVRNGLQHFFRRGTAMVLNIKKPTTSKGRNAADAVWIVQRLDQQRPWVTAGTLGDAKAELVWVSLGGLVGNARDHLEHIPKNQSGRAPNRSVGAIARTEKVHICIHANFVSNAATNNQ